MSTIKKEKVALIEGKQAVKVQGVEWTLWIQKVKTKDGETVYALKPLALKYNQNKKDFYYEPLKAVIWLKTNEFEKLLELLKTLLG